MKTNITIIISAIIISLALVFCGFNISRAISASHVAIDLSNSKSILINETDAAKYIGVDLDTFKNILKEDSKAKQNLSVYTTYKFVPYMVIDGNKYFNKLELDKWVEFNMHNK